jgi:predicted ATP-dependent protease
VEEKESRPPATAALPESLSYESLLFPVRPEDLGFATTAELAGDGEWFGQERALAALELGVQVRHAGFNVYVCGLGGPHRERQVAELLEKYTAEQATPGDRVLVQSFQNPDRPRALYLPAGWGVRLRQDMRDLIEECRRVLPETFRKETFEEEKERLSEQFGEQGEEVNRRLAEHAEQAGFALRPGPGGEILFIPLKDGKPMEPSEIEALTEEQRGELRRRQREVGREVKAVMRQHRSLLRRLSREVKEAERRVASEVVTPLIEEISERFPNPEVLGYLKEVGEHILENLSLFQEQTAPQPAPFPFAQMPNEEDAWIDFEVNVLVDNGQRKGPPVIVEASPTYKNLFGAVERMVDRFGKLVTNFTRVTAGSLLQAHGGCVVVNLLDALAEPLVWRALKQCLKTGELEIETYDPFALFTTSTMKPEPMAIDTRVVLTGPTEFFQLLYFFDEGFREIFKVRADFGYEADAEPELQHNFAVQVARTAAAEDLPPFTAAAVVRLMEYSARLVGDRRKLPSQWNELADLVREAAFWARKSEHPEVGIEDVQQAIEQRTFRLNRVEAKIRELIRDGTVLVDVDGSRVGQVNGLAVLNVAGYEFGRPSRITASVSMGGQGIIAVDREARMSGRTYDKAVFIITGYLRHVYAQGFPLGLSASLSFEQSYSGIDGDSASAAELFALISSLSGAPLRQDLAVTGSVNQFGEIQPIGGVNEKIEGFFYVCREVGLTGRQGVLIPVQNVVNLVLNPDVLEAVRAKQFHLYPIRTVDAGLEILTGMRVGSIDEEGTVHGRAATRLRELAEGLRKFGRSDGRPQPPAAGDNDADKVPGDGEQ